MSPERSERRSAPVVCPEGWAPRSVGQQERHLAGRAGLWEDWGREAAQKLAGGEAKVWQKTLRQELAVSLQEGQHSSLPSFAGHRASVPSTAPCHRHTKGPGTVNKWAWQ